MNKLVLIFDYFKEAYHINRQNKSLYRPQIALIALKALLILLAGIGIYQWIGVERIYALAAMGPEQIFGFVFSQGFKLLAIMLAYALISVTVEAGLLNMYKKAVVQGYTEAGDFKEGLSKYFIKLLLGDLLIIICYILASPFYLIFGIITLTVGLAVIPIVAGVFLTMWKVSLVMNDTGIFEAVKDSFRFAKINFIPLTVLQIVHWSFTKGANSGSGGAGGGSNFNFPNNNNFNGSFGEGFDQGLGDVLWRIPMKEIIVKAINLFKILVGILVPIVTIATISASIIAMIFEVFFSLALFVAYKNGFRAEEKQVPITEALSEALEEVPLIEARDIPTDQEEACSKEVEQ